MKLKRVDIFQAKTIRGATKIPTELRYRIEVRLLRRRRQIADRHVLDHAAAKRADLSHRKTSCLKGWARKTQDPFRQRDTPPAPYQPRKRLRSILKIDLQGNRPPKAKNRQIRLLERAQSSSPFNSF